MIDPQGQQTPAVNVASLQAMATLGGNFCTLILTFPHPDNGDHLLQINIVPDSQAIQQGRWKLQVLGRAIAGTDTTVHAWVERDRNRAVRFVTGDSSEMTVSIPGTAEHVITVAACQSRLPLTLTDSSSRGLTRDGRAKPELCAPGFQITAAASNSPNAQAVATMTGTSMAAPHVAGAVALGFSLRAKSGKTQVNANQVRSLLNRFCHNSNGMHNPLVGFGALDVAAFLNALQQMP